MTDEWRGAADTSLLLAWVVWTYWQLYNGEPSPEFNRAYDLCKQKKLRYLPPRNVFGPVWFFIYGLMAVGGFIFERNRQGTEYYLAVLILMLSNILLNKLWSVLFFKMGSPSHAFAVCFLIWGSAIAVTSICFIDAAELDDMHAQDAAPSYIAAFFWLVYTIWVTYALYLNRAFAMVCDSAKRNAYCSAPSSAYDAQFLVSSPMVDDNAKFVQTSMYGNQNVAYIGDQAGQP